MKDNKLGISFRETMAGGFTLGETEPTLGENSGKTEGNILAMHATVNIRDVYRFISDREHAGNITGRIGFPAFGETIPAKTGVFNLFSPADNPKMKYMVYELGFEHSGKDYYLAGRKEVKDDPGFDLWKDTTTLFTRLHGGKDRSGPVVGAGILSLGVMELMKLVSTMRVTNADSAKEKAEALLAFGRFFMGELWDRYAPKVLK